MKNQLFKISPDREITMEILRNFGINSFEDNHSFTRSNLKDLETVDKINILSTKLRKYYLPCKAKLYLIDLNEKKCITILRQFLKVHNHTLISKEKYVNGIKHLFYQVIPLHIDMSTNRTSEKVIILFN